MYAGFTQAGKLYNLNIFTVRRVQVLQVHALLDTLRIIPSTSKSLRRGHFRLYSARCEPTSSCVVANLLMFLDSSWSNNTCFLPDLICVLNGGCYGAAKALREHDLL
jgi:hypothetical protein